MIYWAILIFLIFMVFFGKKNTIYSKIFYCFFMVFLFLFVAFRYELTWDWFNYTRIYEGFRYKTIDDVLSSVEPLFGLVNYISTQLGFNSIIFNNFIFASIVFVFLALFLKRIRAYWLGLFIYFPVHILVVSMGYVRQSVAIAILLYALIKLWDKKSMQYIFWVFFASLFHRTALIMLVFWPVQFLKLKGFFSFLYSIFSLILIVALLLVSAASENNVYTSGQVSSGGVYLRLILYVIPLIYYIKFRNNFFKNEYKEFYQVLDLFAIMIGLCFILSLGFSTLADRFSLYLVFFNLFVSAALYFRLQNVEKNIFLGLLISTFMLSFAVWQIFGFGSDKSYIYQNFIVNYLINQVF